MGTTNLKRDKTMMIVGLGALGQQYAALALGAGYELVGVDLSEMARRIARDAFPEGRIYASIDEALAVETVVGAVISTPITAHFEAARTILSHGVPVYVEKPAFETSDQFDAIVQLATEKAFFRVGTQFLYLPGLKLTAKMIQSEDATGFIHLVDHCALPQTADVASWRRQVERFVFDMAPHAISIVYSVFPDCSRIETVPLNDAQGRLKGMALHFFRDDALIGRADYLVCSNLTVAGFNVSSDTLMYGFDFKTGFEYLRQGSGNPILDRLLPNLRAGRAMMRSAIGQSIGIMLGRRSSYDQSFAAIEETFFAPPSADERAREFALSRKINEATAAMQKGLTKLNESNPKFTRGGTLQIADPSRAIETVVTGANGFIGKACVKRLIDGGQYVLAITRQPDDELEVLAQSGQIALFTGDYASLSAQLAGLVFQTGTLVYNYAAPVSGNYIQQVSQTLAILDTVLDLVDARNLRLVHISSISVKDFSTLTPCRARAEHPDVGRILRKGPYSYAKFVSEEIVHQRLDPSRFVIVRPGSVWREDRPNSVLTILGRFRGRAIVAGSRRRILPAIHVDELLARIDALDFTADAGHAWDVVASKPLRNGEFFQRYVASDYHGAFYFPRFLVAVIGSVTRLARGNAQRFPDPIIQLANFTKSWSKR